MPSISDRNKACILKYLRFLAVQGQSRNTQTGNGFALRWAAKNVKKDFKALNRSDIEDLMFALESQGYTEQTKYTNKAVLKRFMKWLRKKKSPADWVKLKQPPVKLVKSDLLTFDEVQRITDNAYNIWWKAFIMALYDGNFRKGELLSCKVKDLVLYENYAELSYRDSKTVIGTKIMTLSLPYLIEWSERHPRRDEPDAPLWMTQHHKRWSVIASRGLQLMLKDCAARAGIKKRVFPHLLRHSRTTHLIDQNVPLPIVEKSGRWVAGSKSMQRYIHLSQQDYKNEMLRQAGVITTAGVKAPQLRKCFVCGFMNPENRKKCMKCKRTIDEAEIDLQIRRTIDRNAELEKRMDALEKSRQKEI